MNLPDKCIEQIEKEAKSAWERNGLTNTSFDTLIPKALSLFAKDCLTTPKIYESAGLVKKDSQQSQQGKTPRFASWIIDLLAQKGWKGFEDVDEIKEVVDRAIAEREQSQQGGWISVEDMLPKLSEDVLLYHNDSVCYGYYGYSRGLDKDSPKFHEANADWDGGSLIINPTHWMPLPIPPNSQPIPKKDKLKELEEWARKGTVKCTLGIIANDKYKLGYNGALTDLLSKIQELKNK